MKKLLFILFILPFFSKAQSPIQPAGVAGGQVYFKGQVRVDSIFFLPQYSDTNFIPVRAGAEIFRTADKKLYFYDGTKWAIPTGVAWGQVTGSLSSQTDLQNSLNAKQNSLNSTFGILVTAGVPTWDSGGVRKVDSVYRIVGKDSIYYKINGRTYQILDSAGGGGGSGTITGGAGFSPLFTNGVSGGNTITYTAVNQSPNLFYAGPPLGSATAPTFRALVAADMPTGIPSSNLSNSNIGFTVSTTGSDITWTAASVNLGGTAVLNVPTASASNRGALSSADWSTFNNKVTSVNGRTGVVISKIADTIKNLPIDTTSNRNGYVLSFDSANHKWYLAPGGGGGGTTYSIGTIDGNGAAANGLSISGSSIYAQSASVTVPGLVNNTTQSFSGNKTFTGSFSLTGLTQKVPTGTDSSILRDASGKLWVYPVASFVKYSDTATMLAGYIQNVTSLSPLFTTVNSAHVATFTLSTATAHKFFGNFTGSTAAPSYSSPALASADFANQGTTTTVLHGNAAGNPAWGSVALATDVSGILPIANGGTGTATPTFTFGVGIKGTGSFPAYNIAVDTANFKDTVFARNVGSTVGADSLMYIINNTTIGIRKILFRSNLTVSYNADSTLVLDVTSSGGSGVTSVGAYNSQSPSTNGLVISGTNIYAQSATSTAPGMVSTVSQTFAGAKTFTSAWTVSTLTTNGGIFFGNASGTLQQTPAGLTTQVLHGGVNPTYSAITLTTDVAGILPISNGGTGTSTPGLVAGTGISIINSWPNQTIAAINNGTVTSVNVSGGATGLSFTGGPIVSTGTISVSGTLVVGSGGTGLSSLSPNAVLVGGSTATGTMQQVSAGTVGQFLQYQGPSAVPVWATVSAGGGGSGNAIKDTISCTACGFTVGKIVAIDTASGALVLADTIGARFPLGMVSQVLNANTFEVTESGKVAWTSGLTVAKYQYLSTTAGALTSTSPVMSVPIGQQTSTGVFTVAMKRPNLILPPFVDTALIAGTGITLVRGPGTNITISTSGGGGGGLSSFTSPNSSITIGGTLTNPTVDVNLAYSAAWTSSHSFGAGIKFPSGTGTGRDLGLTNSNLGADGFATLLVSPSNGTNSAPIAVFAPIGTGGTSTYKASFILSNIAWDATQTNQNNLVFRAQGSTNNFAIYSQASGTGGSAQGFVFGVGPGNSNLYIAPTSSRVTVNTGGVDNGTAQFQAQGTTTQIAAHYDASNYGTLSVTSVGNLTIGATGGGIGLAVTANTTAAVLTGIRNFNSTYGVGLVTTNGTSNDPITAGSGSQTTMAVNRVQQATLTATNTSVTYTNSYSLAIDGAPTASTHVTQTNAWSLGVLGGNSQFGGHIETSGTAPTFHGGSLGSNVSSVTPSGTDVAMHVIVVTTGAVNGSIGSIDYNSSWSAAPHVAISCTSSSVSNAAVPIIAKATSSSLLVLSGVISGAGTYEYDIISIK